MKIKLLLGLMIAAAFGFTTVRPTSAAPINGDYEFFSLDPAPNGTGLGNYNVILFANASGGSGNDGGSVNVDNSNTSLPTGSTSDSGLIFWTTSFGDLRAFYDQQFGSNEINNIVLFLDLNESGNSAASSITLNTLSIYLNEPTGLDPATNDLTSTQQNSLTGYIPSTTALTSLSSAQFLAQQNTGQGIDDWSIFTFIDPYDSAYNDNDTLLFAFHISDLNSGGELLSISGTFSACDITPQGCGTTSSGTTTTTTGSSTTTSGTTDGTSTTTTGSSTTTSGTTDGTSTTTGSSTTTTGSSTTTGTGSSGTNSTGVTTGTSGESSGSTEIPEPASFLLLGAGLVAVARMTRKKRD
jgi:hypothetical protein